MVQKQHLVKSVVGFGWACQEHGWVKLNTDLTGHQNGTQVQWRWRSNSRLSGVIVCWLYDSTGRMHNSACGITSSVARALFSIGERIAKGRCGIGLC